MFCIYSAIVDEIYTVLYLFYSVKKCTATNAHRNFPHSEIISSRKNENMHLLDFVNGAVSTYLYSTHCFKSSWYIVSNGCLPGVTMGRRIFPVNLRIGYYGVFVMIHYLESSLFMEWIGSDLVTEDPRSPFCEKWSRKVKCYVWKVTIWILLKNLWIHRNMSKVRKHY